MADHSKDESGRQRGQRPDLAHEQALLRALAQINERTWRELGPLPPGGLPVVPKRKPQQLLPVVPLTVAMLPPSDEDTTMQWKSMTAVVVLATGSALSACEADVTAARVEPTTVAVSDAVAPVGPMPASAAVPSTAEAAETKPAGPNGEKAPEPVRGPAIPAAQFRRQILALLASFEKLENFEKPHVEKLFQIPLRRNPHMTEGYDYEAITLEGWTYSISVDRLYRQDQPSTIYIGLNNGVGSWTDQQPTYCTLEFEPLAKELVAIGYERDTSISRLAGKPSWGFGRESHTNNVGFGIGIYIYELEAADGTKQTCIKGFRIGGGTING